MLVQTNGPALPAMTHSYQVENTNTRVKIEDFRSAMSIFLIFKTFLPNFFQIFEGERSLMAKLHFLSMRGGI